ncbi:palmitoyltransferase ZDHHC11-like [Neofelis nebulosa]|uniref:palmitoyltransferase ZDHHC11-like n=1 Tax=Neofelis nebulosa TaxID=61452 RepID=UPI00272B495B|nr:palmitoyltransferase ZDHHC11-like [Neofelis nebulosa]
MDLCSWCQKGALREASRKPASPRRWSRVNGWSWPLHTFQVVAWTILFILAFTNFCIFVPLLPPNWNLIMYGVTGGLFCFHFVVHLLGISIDPAETNVRLKKYLEPIPTFDPSKHTRVIENQYCHLCEVAVSQKAKHCGACNKCVSDFDHHCKWLNNCVGGRNYRYFFCSLVSASASLLCLISILLYIFIQYSVNPEVLRTHPLYEGVSKDTWLLFLPFFPVKTKALVVLGIGVFVLLLSALSFLLPGYLFIFHLFLMFKKLSTYEYVTQNRYQNIPKVPAGRKELSFKISMPQQADDLSPSARREQRKEAPLQLRRPGLRSTITTCEESSPLQAATGDLKSPSHRVKFNHLLLDVHSGPPSSTNTFMEDSWVMEIDNSLTLSALSLPGSKVSLSLSSDFTTHPTLAAGTEDHLPLKVLKDQQEMSLPVEGDSAEGKGPASGDEEPTLAKWAVHTPMALEIRAREAALKKLRLPHTLPSSSQNVPHMDVPLERQQVYGMEPATVITTRKPADGQVCNGEDIQLPGQIKEETWGRASPPS